MRRKIFVVLTLAGCAIFFTKLQGSESGDVWVAQSSETDSDRFFVSTECYINPAKKRTLAFDLPGTIDFIIPREGDSIKMDQIVAGMVASVAVEDHEIAKINAADTTGIEYAEKSRDVAKVSYEVILNINKKRENTISAEAERESELNWQKSILQVKVEKQKKRVAQKELTKAKARLSTYRFTGRIDGIVTKIYKKSGEAVRQGDPVMEIKDISRVKIEGKLPFADANQIKSGTLVIATFDLSSEDSGKSKLSGKEYRGTVIFVDPEAKRATTHIRFKAEFDNAHGELIPGLMTTLRVYPDKQGPVVPRDKKPAITSIAD